MVIVCRNQWQDIAELTTDFDPALPPTLCAPSHLNELMLNLLTNAAQAITEAIENGSISRGTIAVSTHRRENEAEIRICDTGCGIPEEIRAHVFDPFFTTRDVGKGAGQGLAVAHAIVVEKHGGSIAFDTEIGRGTTFLVRLPLAENGLLLTENSNAACCLSGG